MIQKLSKLLLILFVLPGAVFAHTGVGETTGLAHGFGHPIGGADHLLAMVAVGLWAAQIGGRALWAVPTVFVTVMMLGGVLGFTGVPVPFIEEGILVSVLILGVLIAGAFKLPLAYSAVIVGIFAIFHGYAHGAEMPVSSGAASYTLGFAIATALLHVSGIGAGLLLKVSKVKYLDRYAGGAILFGGIYLALA